MNASLLAPGVSVGRWTFIVAVSIAILVSIASREASARGGTIIHLFPSQMAKSPSTTGSITQTSAPVLAGCGGKRYRDPATHQCRGPADFGN